MTDGKGHQTRFERRVLPAAVPGVRFCQLTSGPGMHYSPYFYNPHLDPEGERLLYVGDQSGTEQVYALDLESGVSTQLTAARGSDQHWSPYIRVGIDGIRPQFIAWCQPDWAHALFWEGNTLKRVHVETLVEEALYDLPDEAVPQILHCSPGGWVSFGYIPRAVQEDIRATLADGGRMQWDEALLQRLTEGCGFVVFDLNARRAVADEHVPFWVNHIQASADHTWVLYCQEGPWQRQRMWLYDVAHRSSVPLRPQDDSAAIGHEFWLDDHTVAYHGTLPDKRGFFGRIDVLTDERTETPSADGERFYGHYHASPDATRIVTDGEITSDHISIARLSDEVRFEPVARHGWVRSKDQRHHPHPHWHSSGRFITFTGCEEHGTQAFLLDLGDATS
ncbi:MAG TPA: oligogalacturonate lyase family protein [Chloroflexota bacterium]|nr:oligogalacturonate lyase family protein [Chloroflexota bacterium]